MKNIPNNLISSITVKRPIQQTTTTVEQPQNDYEDLNLPFYYSIGPTLGFWLIVLGVILLIVQYLGPFIFFILLKKRKNYICTHCHRQFLRKSKNPQICPTCGGEVIEMKNNK